VDLDLTADQDLLRDTSERFIESTLPLARVRELVDSRQELDPKYLAGAAELGWFAALAPEDLGGGTVSGFGVLDAAIFAELRGRRVQPGAFVDTNVVVAALVADGSETQRTEVVSALLAGEATAAWAVADGSGDWSGATGVEVAAAGDGYRLSGTKAFVVDAHTASWLLVTAAGPAGPTQVLVAPDLPGLTIEPLVSFDLTRTLCEVRFDGALVDADALVGAPGAAAATVERQVQLATVLAVAESVGAMDHLFDITVEYCIDRTAFGRPIGSFQAVKHQVADTAMLLEMSKAAAVAAAQDVQAALPRAGQSASIAKAFVAEAGVELAHKCWQNFGGIAYTWEHDFHLYLRRLTADASMYGSAAWHRERICRLEGI
jgi:alkylation response protein AidB-like acyl-CoA dehydrogenase